MDGRDVEECYLEHSDALLRFAASQVGAVHADDVVSRAVLDVLRRGVTDVDDLRGYLYRSVANAGRKHWRASARRRRRDVVLLAPQGHTDRLDRGFSREMLNALGDLSVQQRAVIHLAYVEDLTAAMVADRLGVSEGTVRRQLARARQRLRKALHGQ